MRDLEKPMKEEVMVLVLTKQQITTVQIKATRLQAVHIDQSTSRIIKQSTSIANYKYHTQCTIIDECDMNWITVHFNSTKVVI